MVCEACVREISVENREEGDRGEILQVGRIVWELSQGVDPA